MVLLLLLARLPTGLDLVINNDKMMFLLLTLAGLPAGLNSMPDQILATHTVPKVDKLFSLDYYTLPHLPVTPWSCHQMLTPLFSDLGQ